MAKMKKTELEDFEEDFEKKDKFDKQLLSFDYIDVNLIKEQAEQRGREETINWLLKKGKIEDCPLPDTEGATQRILQIPVSYLEKLKSKYDSKDPLTKLWDNKHDARWDKDEKD